MIIGFDEAGRGPLAGPVCAGAVILPSGFPVSMLNDSKKLSPKRREAARKVIMEEAAWGLGWASAEEIDRINILQASLLAMKRAWDDLARRFPCFRITAAASLVEGIADGLYIPRGLPFPCRALVKADAKVGEVMAASILAKTERDHLMIEYAKKFPQYGYEKHKGYPTRAHLEAIARYGPSPIQRKTFRAKAPF
jgi:ribonuclease HII